MQNKAYIVYHRGTPRYMAPEQYKKEGLKNLFKVEVFSLGVILFNLIFKTYPFSLENFHEEGRNPAHIDNYINSERNVY